MLQDMDLSLHSCKLNKIYQDNMQLQTRHTWTKNVLLKVLFVWKSANSNAHIEKVMASADHKAWQLLVGVLGT